MKIAVKKLLSFIAKNKKYIILFSILFLILFLNGFHEEYPDEYDSIVGGKYILEGKIPYRDWFQHHQPGTYLLASSILMFTGTSFVRFRVGLSVAYFLISFLSYIILKKRINENSHRASKGTTPSSFTKNFDFYIVFLFIYALAATYYWGQMLLSDTLSAILILPAYSLLFIKEVYGQKINEKDLIVISIFSFLTWFTSMTYIYVIAGIVVYTIYKYFTNITQKPFNKNVLKTKIIRAAVIIILPYTLFFLFFLVTGSIKEYYFANITYNQNYYIYNYPRGPGSSFNPIRYAIVIAHDFFVNYFTILSGILKFPLNDPLNTMLALSSASAGAYFIIRKRYAFVFLWLIVLIYSNARSNPQTIKETDYQASVYILTSLFSGTSLLWIINHNITKEKLDLGRKALLTFLFILLTIYWSFSILLLAFKFHLKYYDKYMGNAPLIYDRPEVANTINTLVKSDEYAWVGPFSFKELFYLGTKVPSKYHWFLDHAKRSEKIKTEIMSDFEKNRPKIIVFDRSFAPWGGNAETYNYFFTAFLDKNYFRIADPNDEKTNRQLKISREAIEEGYKWKVNGLKDYNFPETFNFDLKYKNEIITQLINAGFIEKK